MRCAVTLWILCSLACARPARETLTPVRSPFARLADADALLASGCLDCLLDAYRGYAALASEPAVRVDALTGSVRAALLVVLREHELGLEDDGYFTFATENAPAASPDVAALLPMVATLAALPPLQRSPVTDTELGAIRELGRQQTMWTALLAERAAPDVTSAYLWLSLACGGRLGSGPRPETPASVLEASASVSLVHYKAITACDLPDGEALRGHLAREARARETHYYLGLAALRGAGRANAPRGVVDVDEASRQFDIAYAWRPKWLTVTIARGNVALSAEDYERAAAAFDETLALKSDDPDGLMGSIRALTYLGRHEEAIARADRLLASGRNPGDALYWRAFNEHGLKQYDAAWTDIERAATLLVNADVPKLGGLVALARGRVAESRVRFETALGRRPSDCETGYYLQAVLATERDWNSTARVAANAATCLDGEEQRLTAEIQSLQLSDIDAARRARQVASRENSLRSTRRMRAATWFNAAVANYNLSQPDSARAFASLLLDDDDFALRARDLLSRLDAR